MEATRSPRPERIAAVRVGALVPRRKAGGVPEAVSGRPCVGQDRSRARVRDAGRVAFGRVPVMIDTLQRKPAGLRTETSVAIGSFRATGITPASALQTLEPSAFRTRKTSSTPVDATVAVGQRPATVPAMMEALEPPLVTTPEA